MGARTVVLVALGAAAPAYAANGECRVVDVSIVPSDKLQIVAWIEDAAGNYIDTFYITQTVGRYGLGNRPGRFDFNSGPRWPFGRRITALPVWAHKNGMKFPELEFQNGLDNDLSHPFEQSSPEPHYCQPSTDMNDPHWIACDAGTNASPPGSDKGVFSPTKTTGYPPRADLMRMQYDSASVDMMRTLDVFDAISQATPAAGATVVLDWPVPPTLPDGNYVLWLEVGKEQDFNSTYNSTSYPSPTGISFASWGVAYRGQPSIVWKVPFTVTPTGSMTTAASYAGYGDPDGAETFHLPDATITTNTPGSGASRLLLLPGTSDRISVHAYTVPDVTPPAEPGDLVVAGVSGSSATLTFTEPGDDGVMGKVTSYEIRVRANSEMTVDNFADSMAVSVPIQPQGAGSQTMVVVDNLLPLTDYWIGLRAYDKCHNPSPVAIAHVTTLDRQSAAVDACFVATAAYGSAMANDVWLLRHFRDAILRQTVLGELATEGYYTFGPALAGFIGESELLRASARGALAPVVARVRTLEVR